MNAPRVDLVPCDRCGHSARIPPTLRLPGGLAKDEQARLALARHQRGGKCKVESFARAARARDLVRVGAAWRLVKAGIVPAETGPATYTPARREHIAAGEASDDIIAHAQWIPRWAAIVWAAMLASSLGSEGAEVYARIVRDATEEERAALLSAYDLGGFPAARLFLYELRVRYGASPPGIWTSSSEEDQR